MGFNRPDHRDSYDDPPNSPSPASAARPSTSPSSAAPSPKPSTKPANRHMTSCGGPTCAPSSSPSRSSSDQPPRLRQRRRRPRSAPRRRGRRPGRPTPSTKPAPWHERSGSNQSPTPPCSPTSGRRGPPTSASWPGCISRRSGVAEWQRNSRSYRGRPPSRRPPRPSRQAGNCAANSRCKGARRVVRFSGVFKAVGRRIIRVDGGGTDDGLRGDGSGGPSGRTRPTSHLPYRWLHCRVLG